MAWRVLVTSRNFLMTTEPRAYLEGHNCTLVDTVYGGAADDSQLASTQVIQLLEGAHAVITGAAISETVLSRTGHLKIVSRRGVGYDKVDVPAATKRGIAVTITPHAMDGAVADHVFALILAAARHIPEAHIRTLEGRWQPLIGHSVHNKTLGIIGLGRIGREVARRAQGFQMNILAHDVQTDEVAETEMGVRYVDLDELLRQSDFISVNVSLSEGTRHLIGDREFNLMKPTCIVVNAARGGIIDEGALLRALNTKRIAGAALDTFETEPPIADHLKASPNLVVTPHIAGYTLEALADANMMAAQNAVAFLEGRYQDVRGLINPEILSQPKSPTRTESVPDGRQIADQDA